MPFGQKSGSLKNLKQSLARGGGAGFIKFIPKNGVLNVRFIQQPEEWVNYVEHYDQVARKSFPCNGEPGCPGCLSGERKSSRYLANVVDLDDDKKRVVPLQMPKDLANRIVVKYEKWGSITDRDIELSRTGEGLDTTYDLEPSPPDRKRIDNYQPLDLLKSLEDAFNSVFGDGTDPFADDADEPPKKATVRGRKRSAAAEAVAEPDPDSTLDDVDDGADEPAEPVFAVDNDPDDDPDDEPEADDDEDDDDGFTEADLRGMPLGVLRATARSFGIATKGKSQDTLVAEIMESGEEVGADEEPPF